MDNCIRISGKDDEGPWDVQRIEGGLLTSDIRKAHGFGALCRYVIEMIEGRYLNYGIDYQGPDGIIFEKTEEDVLFYIIDVHNRAVETNKKLEELI